MGNFFTQVWESIKGFFSGYGLTLVKALAVLVVGLLVILIVTGIVKKNSTKSRKIDNSAASFVTSVVSIVAYVVLVILVIGALGFSTTGIISALSSVMLAIALGLQNTLASLANGILLIVTKPFQAGDFVEVAGTSGTVKEVNLFSVKIVTVDNLEVVVPNNTVFNSTIINYSKMPVRRVDLVLPVSYDVNVAQLKELVLAHIEKDARIVKDPAPFFRLTEYGASSLNFTLRVWVNAGDFWAVKLDLMEQLIDLTRENNIEIPFDQLDVHVINTAVKEVEEA